MALHRRDGRQNIVLRPCCNAFPGNCLLYTSKAIGVNAIHFGIIVTVNLAIAMFTPPFGLNLFMSASIFNVSVAKVMRGCVPFIAVYLVALMLVTYIPAISLWLPNVWR